MPAESDEIDCERCGTTIESGDAYSLDGYEYCSSCHDDVQYESEQEDEDRHTEGVHSYGYKPQAMFFNSDGHASRNASRITEDNGIVHGRPYMGMEIEVEDPNGRHDHDDIVQEIHNRTNGLVYVKEDCSLSNGFEIVTHPMTIGYLQNHADGLGSALSYLRTRGFRAWQTSTCGLHIHISKNSFKDAKHEMKFLYFVYCTQYHYYRF